MTGKEEVVEREDRVADRQSSVVIGVAGIITPSRVGSEEERAKESDRIRNVHHAREVAVGPQKLVGPDNAHLAGAESGSDRFELDRRDVVGRGGAVRDPIFEDDPEAFAAARALPKVEVEREEPRELRRARDAMAIEGKVKVCHRCERELAAVAVGQIVVDGKLDEFDPGIFQRSPERSSERSTAESSHEKRTDMERPWME